MFKRNYSRYGIRSNRNRNRNSNRNHFNKTFDPRNIINNTQEVEKTEIKINNKFSDFLLSDIVKQSIKGRGYDTPTPIQDRSIPEILLGNDIVGIANTGTGKTAAFLIPLIDKIIKDDRSRVLIVAPTRELAGQIGDELNLFSQKIGISSVICIGGVSIRPQIARLSNNPKFVIGTPGRLIDLNNQRKINFSRYDNVVLDEVDRMLDMGFIKDVKRIISRLPRRRQSLFFSATLDNRTKEIMTEFSDRPIIISISSPNNHSNIHQDIVETRGRDKIDVLCNILDKKEVAKALVFIRTKRSADKLHQYLSRAGFQASVLHGNKSQNQRQRSLDEFKNDKVNILIATDVASRGIDVDDITHVINFDLPESHDAYIHRIGRTGRANKKGIALTFV